MPVHDWTKVHVGIFHSFHLQWIGDIARVLNRGLLPPDCYALAEQVAGDFAPYVLTLSRTPHTPLAPPSGGTALADVPPKVDLRLLPQMPLFLSSDVYVTLPLETTYRSAFESMPAFLQSQLEEGMPK